MNIKKIAKNQPKNFEFNTKNIELAYTKIYEKHLNKLPIKNIEI